ncbi:unnamed protein product [Durusdinium trenchii]|uniref:Glycosyl transferase family 25 domain-containing protein n=1 Tax=Durusdinium trenchii TaxID=1381693 RepID=A0ABP0LCG2_9DINO
MNGAMPLLRVFPPATRAGSPALRHLHRCGTSFRRRVPTAALPCLVNVRCIAIGALVGRGGSRRGHPIAVPAANGLGMTGLGQWSLRPGRRLIQRKAATTESLSLGERDEVLSLPPTFWDSVAELEWCAVYINLARRPDRKAKLLEKLQHFSPQLCHQIRRLEAIDGQQLTLRHPAVALIVDDAAVDRARHARRRGAYTIVHSEGRLLHFDNHLTLGGIACAMSHRLALEAVVKHPTAQWGIILEDDIAALVPKAEEVIQKAIEQLPEDWDALFLGYHDDAGRAHPGAFEQPAGEPIEVSVRPMREPCFGLFAWVVRRPAAEVDHAISSWLVQERGRCYQVEPGSMVFFSPKSEEAEDSDIQTMATVDAFMNKFESWQAYYEHVWGMDSIMEGYLLGDSEDEDWEDWLQDEFQMPLSGITSPPCDVPPPECYGSEA